MPVETEIKFRLDPFAGLAGFTARLEACGFTLETPRSFESNVLYDTPDRQMRARTEILRIRFYAGRCTLTHKRPLDATRDALLPIGASSSSLSLQRQGDSALLPAREFGSGDDLHKHRIETETVISDGDSLAQVFLSLGLVPTFRYEKWRTEWAQGQGHCVIDETPIGNYAELEGPAAWIDQTAARLGVDPSAYITLSYGRLFDLWREQHASSVQDLTFAAIADALRG